MRNLDLMFILKHQTRPRPRSPRRVLVSLALAVLILALAACSGSSDGSGSALPDDGPPPTRSTEAAMSLLNKAAAAAQAAAQTGQVELLVTEEEVNSILGIGRLVGDQSGALSGETLEAFLERAELEGGDVTQLRELLNLRDRAPGEDRRGFRLRPRIVDPVVYFRGSGHLIVRGEASWLIVRLPFRAVTAPRATEGELEFDFVEGQVGAVPMPEFVFDLLGRGVSEAVLLGEAYAQITEISVGTGTLSLRGAYQH